jgi:hypothetical protein
MVRRRPGCCANTRRANLVLRSSLETPLHRINYLKTSAYASKLLMVECLTATSDCLKLSKRDTTINFLWCGPLRTSSSLMCVSSFARDYDMH